jgi:hypothetical protein
MGVLKIRSGGAWIPVAQGVGIASPGFVGAAQLAADQTITAAAGIVDITGVSVTWTAIAGHIYRTWVEIGAADHTTAAGQQTLYLTDAANTNKRVHGVSVGVAERRSHTMFIDETGLSGTQTRKARMAASGGTIVLAASGGAAPYAPRMVVEDITTATMDGLATPWTAVTFQNGWANKGSPEQPCQYRKIGDIVYLRGMMTRNPVPFATAAFNLPVGFRPPALVRPTPIVGNASYTLTLSRADITIQGDYLASAGNADSMWWPIDFQFSTV